MPEQRFFFPGRVWKGVGCEFPFPSRPDPTRPGPARPGPTGHFGPRVSALKMADLGPSVLVVLGYLQRKKLKYKSRISMDLHETVSQSSVWAENYGNPNYFGTRNPFLILPRPPGALLGAFWPLTLVPIWGWFIE